MMATGRCTGRSFAAERRNVNKSSCDMNSDMLLKTEALENAELMTEEEEEGILSTDTVIESVLIEFNKLADEIDHEQQ